MPGQLTFGWDRAIRGGWSHGWTAGGREEEGQAEDKEEAELSRRCGCKAGRKRSRVSTRCPLDLNRMHGQEMIDSLLARSARVNSGVHSGV